MLSADTRSLAHSEGEVNIPSVQLTLVSDSSHARDQMSFGWTFSIHEGTRIAECSGPGYGPGTSHCAEGYGVLSAVQFLIRLQEFLVIEEPWAVWLVSNNQGLITRLNQCKQYTMVYPNSTLALDWDLVEQITASLGNSLLQPTFVHVKGHQDDRVAYEDLCLDAQMNVDLLASTIVIFPHQRVLYLFMLPVTGAQLNLGPQTITSRYARHICTAAGTPAYLEYLHRNNNWDDSIWQTVDRVALRRVIARHSHRYVNVVKMIHDYLPTTAIWLYTDPTVRGCKLCQADNSTFCHVIRCPHPTRQEWRHKFVQAV